MLHRDANASSIVHRDVQLQATLVALNVDENEVRLPVVEPLLEEFLPMLMPVEIERQIEESIDEIQAEKVVVVRSALGEEDDGVRGERLEVKGDVPLVAGHVLHVLGQIERDERRGDEELDGMQQRRATSIVHGPVLFEAARSIDEQLLADVQREVLVEDDGDVLQAAVKFLIGQILISAEVDAAVLEVLFDLEVVVELEVILVDHHGQLAGLALDLHVMPLIVDQMEIFRRRFVPLTVPAVLDENLAVLQLDRDRLLEQLHEQRVVVHGFELKLYGLVGTRHRPSELILQVALAVECQLVRLPFVLAEFALIVGVVAQTLIASVRDQTEAGTASSSRTVLIGYERHAAGDLQMHRLDEPRVRAVLVDQIS